MGYRCPVKAEERDRRIMGMLNSRSMTPRVARAVISYLTGGSLVFDDRLCGWKLNITLVCRKYVDSVLAVLTRGHSRSCAPTAVQFRKVVEILSDGAVVAGMSMLSSNPMDLTVYIDVVKEEQKNYLELMLAFCT